MEEEQVGEADIELQVEQGSGDDDNKVGSGEGDGGSSEVKRGEEVEEQRSAKEKKKKSADKVVEGLAWFGGKVLAGIEFIGEIVANVLGLNESRYQWVMDTMNEQEWEAARRTEEQRRAGAAATSMEGGASPPVGPDTPTETATEDSIASENTANLNA